MVRDASVSGPRLLRPPARGAARSRVRRLRGGRLPSVLRQDHGRTLRTARSDFRMHMVGYFEGIDSERGIEWRCSASFSLREFLRLEMTDRVPDHSWVAKTRSRLPQEVHERVFGWVLALIADRGLVRGERIGVDASTLEANAALRAIVRRDTGEGYREMLERMAQESGIETPTAEDLIRLDRKRKSKTLSNEEWV